MRSFFDINLIDFGDDWDKQCTEINALFPELIMLFSNSALVLLVSMNKFKHFYASGHSKAQHNTAPE